MSGYGIFLFVFGHLLFKYRRIFADPPQLEYKTSTTIIDICFLLIALLSIVYCEFFRPLPELKTIPDGRDLTAKENEQLDTLLIGDNSDNNLYDNNNKELNYQEIETKFQFTYKIENPATKKVGLKEFHKKLLDENSRKVRNYERLSRSVGPKKERLFDFKEELSKDMPQEKIESLMKLYPFISDFKSFFYFKTWLYLNMIDLKIQMILGEDEKERSYSSLTYQTINNGTIIL